MTLAGRNKRTTINWLLLPTALLEDLRHERADVDAKDLPIGGPRLAEVRKNPRFYRLLKRGPALNREGSKRPVSEGTYSQASEIFAKNSVIADDNISARNGPIIIELEGPY